ncbi:MAG: hypothetical protein J0I06_00015, partial [Planctomycetes bacterium]|nr:hypothetical protein [Planctomycetota bacterium]
MTVVHAMLSNAAVAALLALAALAVGRFCRSPRVRHAVWLVVLLKLVTPPLFDVPLAVLPASWEAEPAGPPAVRVFVSPPAATASRAPVDAAVSAPAACDRYRPRGAFEWLVAVWAAGAVGWFVWQGR